MEERNAELSDDNRILVQLNPKIGVEGLADLELTIYPMNENGAFLVGAYYVIRVEGIDADVPGYVLSLAERVEGGGWRLNHDEDFYASWEEYIEESDMEDISWCRVIHYGVLRRNSLGMACALWSCISQTAKPSETIRILCYRG